MGKKWFDVKFFTVNRLCLVVTISKKVVMADFVGIRSEPAYENGLHESRN